MNSHSPSRHGKLIMAANSLGLIEDIPQRSLAALRQSDLLIFEEDRCARQSLKAAGVHRPYLKLSEHQEKATLEEFKICLKKGETVCYMSDQGMPVLADPGRQLLEIAYQFNVHIEIIPGPSSVSAAIAACPFISNGFVFEGFLPRTSEQRLASLARLNHERKPTIILDTPYRRQAVLKDALDTLGQDRQALLAVDITGPQESYFLGTLRELNELEIEKLNFVLIISGKSEQAIKKQQSKTGRKRSSNSTKQAKRIPSKT